LTGGSPPFNDERGLLVELPVFGSAREPRPDRWLIVELDLNYARSVWLPELIGKYLNSDGKAIDEAIVRTACWPADVLYSTPTNSTSAGASAVSVRFNRLGRAQPELREPEPGGGGHWLLETWQRPGALEAIVSASRRRNLGIAGAINLILFLTGLALIRYTSRSRQLAEQQMKFVAGVSHELRTPLTVIRGAAYNIQRGVVSERSQIEKYSGLIIEYCEQLTEMIEQVLALAGMQKGRSVAVRQPLALANVLREAMGVTAHDTQAAHCEVHITLPPDLPAVTGDASALRRAFQNLICNAAKHGGQGGWIGITASGDHDGARPMVEVQVSDRGPGIPAEEQEKIFTPFFRGSKAQTSQTRGSGLGLSLVKEIIEAHGGEVSVRSAVGQGAIFTVRLPVAANGKEP
jgi:signal transduction histidine kinase